MHWWQVLYLAPWMSALERPPCPLWVRKRHPSIIKSVPMNDRFWEVKKASLLPDQTDISANLRCLLRDESNRYVALRIATAIFTSYSFIQKSSYLPSLCPIRIEIAVPPIDTKSCINGFWNSTWNPHPVGSGMNSVLNIQSLFNVRKHSVQRGGWGVVLWYKRYHRKTQCFYAITNGNLYHVFEQSTLDDFIDQ